MSCLKSNFQKIIWKTLKYTLIIVINANLKWNKICEGHYTVDVMNIYRIKFGFKNSHRPLVGTLRPTLSDLLVYYNFVSHFLKSHILISERTRVYGWLYVFAKSKCGKMSLFVIQNILWRIRKIIIWKIYRFTLLYCFDKLYSFKIHIARVSA